MSDLIQMPHAAVLPVIRSAVTPGTGWELFNPLSLSPLVYFDALGGSMLDSGGAAASHGDNVATLTDLGANGDDATQSTDSLRPVALTETGLYLPGVLGNYASFTGEPLDFAEDFRIRCRVFLADVTGSETLFGNGINERAILLGTTLQFRAGGTNVGTNMAEFSSAVSVGWNDLVFSWDSAANELQLVNNGASVSTETISTPVGYDIERIGQGPNIPLAGVISDLEVAPSLVDSLVISFASQAHGATSITAETGQTVTINQSGDDPATLLRYPVARFDGSDDFLSGTFASTLTGGWMFAVYSRLGTTSNARVFAVTVGGSQSVAGAAFFAYQPTTTEVAQLLRDPTVAGINTETLVQGGRAIVDSFMEAGDQRLRVNGGAENSATNANTISADGFEIGGYGSFAAIDLHHLSLYPASLTSAEATKVRNYLNARYNIYA